MNLPRIKPKAEPRGSIGKGNLMAFSLKFFDKKFLLNYY